MKKGIVMEMDEAFLTLLTPEGEFLRARKQNELYVIGEEIDFFPIDIHKTQRLFTIKNLLKVKPIWAVSVMAALLILLGSFIPMYQDNKAYAYMSIDVNPSIELGVNKKMQVVELTGFNKEGKKIISSINDWKKKDVSKIAQAILSEIKNEGFLKNNLPVIISTVHTTKPVKQVESKLKENIEEIKTTVTNQKLEVTVYTSTEKEREKAQKLGMTTGKYHENEVNASINEKKQRKLNQKQKDRKGNTIKTQQKSVLPPGQLKKQTENGTTQNHTPVNKGQQNSVNDGKRTSSLPGQLKKVDEEKYKQNYGQVKKQLNQKDSSNKDKKDYYSNKNQKSSHYEKSSHDEKSSHYEKSSHHEKSSHDERSSHDEKSKNNDKHSR
jgi:hypothetical protein